MPKIKLSHNEALQRAGLPSTEVLAKRVLRWFDSAAPSDIEAGSRWYHDAHALASDLAVVLANDGDGLRRAAEVIAALSPRTFWSRNAAGAALLVIRGEALPGLLGRNVAMARAIIGGENLEDLTKGPKIQSFARNIAGDTSVCTIDVHAAYAVGVDEALLSRKGVYAAVEKAYQLAAARRGIEPSTIQATVWIVARRQRLSDQRRR